jgi:hypothetical protein
LLIIPFSLAALDKPVHYFNAGSAQGNRDQRLNRTRQTSDFQGARVYAVSRLLLFDWFCSHPAAVRWTDGIVPA